MPVGNELFRSASAPRSEGSVLCRRCGYDLRGIDPGGRCPECGVAIRVSRSRRRLGDTITDAPSSYLTFLASSCWLALVTCLVSIGVYIAAMTIPDLPVLRMIWGLAALGWVGAVFLLTADRRSSVVDETELRREWRRSRWIARLTQCAWPIAAGLATWQSFLLVAAAAAAPAWPTVNGTVMVGAPPLPALVETLAYGIIALFLIGMVGIGFLCFHLASLAYWGKDEPLEMRLRTCAYFICGGVPIFLLAYQVQAAPGLIGVAGFFAFMIFTVLVAGGWITFLVGLGQLAMLSIWAVDSAGAEAARDQRMLEKAHAHAEALNAREYANPPPPVDLRPSGEATKAPKPRGNYVEPSKAAEIYDVKD